MKTDYVRPAVALLIAAWTVYYSPQFSSAEDSASIPVLDQSDENTTPGVIPPASQVTPTQPFVQADFSCSDLLLDATGTAHDSDVAIHELFQRELAGNSLGGPDCRGKKRQGTYEELCKITSGRIDCSCGGRTINPYFEACKEGEVLFGGAADEYYWARYWEAKLKGQAAPSGAIVAECIGSFPFCRTSFCQNSYCCQHFTRDGCATALAHCGVRDCVGFGFGCQKDGVYQRHRINLVELEDGNFCLIDSQDPTELIGCFKRSDHTKPITDDLPDEIVGELHLHYEWYRKCVARGEWGSFTVSKPSEVRKNCCRCTSATTGGSDIVLKSDSKTCLQVCREKLENVTAGDEVDCPIGVNPNQ